MNEKPNLINIGKKSFLSVVIILFVLMIAAGIMTRTIPAGEYLRDAEAQIIPGSFAFLTEDVNFPIWKWFLAPFLVLGSSDALMIIMIALFLLILGGTFTVMDKTGGIKVMIKKLINRYKDKKYTLIRLVILVFMVFGSFFGIFEESVALLPIMIMLSLSLGFDTMVGISICLLAAGFGFASALTNPFSVGIASTIAGVSLLSGFLFRLGVFGIMYFLLTFFVVKYAKKIELDPTKSITYTEDQAKVKNFDLFKEIDYPNENLIFKSYLIMFVSVLGIIVILSVLELIDVLSISAIPFIALAFLIGGLVSGTMITGKFMTAFKMFLKGVLSVLPAVLMILMAASVKYIISEGKVIDSILYYLANVLTGQGPIVGILMIYALVLVLQFFIGSASAKAYLIMPLLVPLVSLIGISKELSILAFVFGDGYTNVIFPTNAVLLIGLSIASVSYQKWFRFTWKLQLITLGLTVLLLIGAHYIGY